jgi:hypothetical protein
LRQRLRYQADSQHFGNLIATIAGQLSSEIAAMILLRGNIDRFSGIDAIVAGARAQSGEDSASVRRASL